MGEAILFLGLFFIVFGLMGYIAYLCIEDAPVISLTLISTIIVIIAAGIIGG